VGDYEPDPGATLKWLDDRGKQHSLETRSIWIAVIDE